MFLHTFLLVFIAEMADKTQLMMMALCQRYTMRQVIFGMGLGILAISGISVAMGDLIGDIIPLYVVKIAAAIMFLSFGLWNLRGNAKEEESSGFSFKHLPFLSIALTFMLAELGDKTQLATVAIAADHMDAHLQVFLGGAGGLFMANMIGIFAGRFLFSHISEASMNIGSSFLFFLFGSITLFEAIPASTFVLTIYSILLIVIAYHIYTRTHKTHGF